MTVSLHFSNYSVVSFPSTSPSTSQNGPFRDTGALHLSSGTVQGQHTNSIRQLSKWEAAMEAEGAYSSRSLTHLKQTLCSCLSQPEGYKNPREHVLLGYNARQIKWSVYSLWQVHGKVPCKFPWWSPVNLINMWELEHIQQDYPLSLSHWYLTTLTSHDKIPCWITSTWEQVVIGDRQGELAIAMCLIW